MKYLKKFETDSDVQMYILPNVVLVEDTDTVLYNTLKEGVFIQHIDGTTYTTDEWTASGFTNEQANGVAVVTPECSFVIAKNYIGAYDRWTKTTKLIDGVVTTQDSSAARLDYAGVSNTAVLASIEGNVQLNDCAAYRCVNYEFPDGKKGYLPSAGEAIIAIQNTDAIREAMTTIGGEELTTSMIWTSTQASASDAWIWYWNTGITTMSKNGGGNSIKTLAFASL